MYLMNILNCKVYYKHMNIATNSHDEQKYHQVKLWRNIDINIRYINRFALQKNFDGACLKMKASCIGHFNFCFLTNSSWSVANSDGFTVLQ